MWLTRGEDVCTSWELREIHKVWKQSYHGGETQPLFSKKKITSILNWEVDLNLILDEEVFFQVGSEKPLRHLMMKTLSQL